MKFTEILEELKKGEKVTREKWGEPDCTIDFIVYDQNKGKFMFCYNDNYHSFIFVDEDIIAEDWKIYEEKPTRIWKPEFDEKYYYMTTSGNVAQDTFNTSFDKYRLSFRNVFKTTGEARKMVEKLKIINKLKELSNVNFNDSSKPHYAIAYNCESKCIICSVNYNCREQPFSIYFDSLKDCEKAIDTIGEDNLKKYYFDVEEL